MGNCENERERVLRTIPKRKREKLARLKHDARANHFYYQFYLETFSTTLTFRGPFPHFNLKPVPLLAQLITDVKLARLTLEPLNRSMPYDFFTTNLQST